MKKSDSTTVSNRALKYQQKQKQKCDSLYIAFDKVVKENNDLTKKIIDNADEFKTLNTEKENLKKEIDKKEDLLEEKDKKRVSFGLTAGVIPTVRNEKITVTGSIMLGVHYRFFSF